MTKRRAGRGSKYSDDFKRQLVAESYAAGVSVPMVAKKHGVGTERIYTWRGDARFQPDAPEDAAFMPVEVAQGDSDVAPAFPEAQPTSILTRPSHLR